MGENIVSPKQVKRSRWERFIRWLADSYLLDEYLRGWSAGVNQLHHEPRTAMHGIIDYDEYMGYGEDE